MSGTWSQPTSSGDTHSPNAGDWGRWTTEGVPGFAAYADTDTSKRPSYLSDDGFAHWYGRICWAGTVRARGYHASCGDLAARVKGIVMAPSASDFNRQLRAAQRKAEQQLKREVTALNR